jgi:DNA-binding protein HU-beta
MSKATIIDFIVKNSSISKAQAEQVLESLFTVISNDLVKDSEASIPGIGTFKLKETAERQGRNPATGEAMTIAAGKKIAFKAAKKLKDLCCD